MNPETKREEAPPPYPHQSPYGGYSDDPQGRAYGAPQGQTQSVVDPTSDPNYGYDDKPIVIQPGIMMTTPEPYADVPDYLVLSIISIFFCTCLGIVSIVKSSNARQMKAAGRYQTALSESTSAKSTAIAAILIGGILTVIMVVVRIAIISASGDGPQ